MPAMTSKSVFDKDGAETKMAARTPADGITRPVHHSEVITLQQTVTRPANVTAYAAGAAIGAAADVKFTFDIAAAGIPAGLIIAARLVRDQTTNTSVRFRAGVHDAVPNTLPAGDGAAAPLLWANRVSRRGWVDFSNPHVGVAAGSNCADYAGVLSNAQGIPVNPADGKLTLTLGTLDAFVPVSGENYLLEIDMVA